MFGFISEKNKEVCAMATCRQANALEPLCQTEGDPEVSRGHKIKVNKLP